MVSFAQDLPANGIAYGSENEVNEWISKHTSFPKWKWVNEY